MFNFVLFKFPPMDPSRQELEMNVISALANTFSPRYVIAD